jgi:N-acetylneuraminic acid mutarotase
MSLPKILVALLSVANVQSSDIEWVTLGSKIPYTVSDMSATVFPAFSGSKIVSDSIILTGGCSSPNGNEHFEGNFYCNEFTDKVSIFYPSTAKWDDDLVPNMLIPRYRHCAVEVKGKLYVVGGRTDNDLAVSQVDVSFFVSRFSYRFILKLMMFSPSPGI